MAQAPQWEWAAQAAGTNYISSSSIATDSQGNQYVTGWFRGSATFGSHTLTATASDAEIFVAKMSPTGNWIWAVQASGTFHESGTGIALDGAGNIFVTGHFWETVTFGSHTLTSSGASDILVAKLDADGNWLWVVKAGGSDFEGGLGIAVDSAGNAYVTGTFGGTVTFGSHTLTVSGGVGNYYDDIFVAKVSPNGNWLWAVNAGGTYNDEGQGIALDSTGNIYVTGKFRDIANFGSYTLTMGGDQHDTGIFVAKLNPNGNWLWAVQAEGVSMNQGSAISVDSAGNAYVTGQFMFTATFGSHTLTVGEEGWGSHIFVAKLSPNGNWLWAISAGGSMHNWGSGIALDDEGSAYVTGVFSGTATFGNLTLTASGDEYDQDLFAAKLDATGNWLWALQAGGLELDYGNGIDLDGAGNAYVTGEFGDIATFGSHTLTAIGNSDIFISKIGPYTGASIPVPPENLSISISGSDVLLDWDDVTVDQSGNPVSVAHYLVHYCATSPEGPFTVYGEDGSITGSQWTHSGAATPSRGFYHVTAVVR